MCQELDYCVEPGTTVAMSDGDKVNLQLQYDVKAFTDIAQNLCNNLKCEPGVTVSDLPPVAALHERVAAAPSVMTPDQ
jgi:hypothetical protein